MLIQSGPVDSGVALVEVAQCGEALAVVAGSGGVRDGQELLELIGRTAARATRYSVQIDAEVHLVPPPGLTQEELIQRHPWCFLNHSCAPTARLVWQGQRVVVVAVRDLAPGVEVTFDYCTTEWDMAEPFACGCGAADCLGLVQGHRALDAAQRAARDAHSAPFLRRLAAVDAPN